MVVYDVVMEVQDSGQAFNYSASELSILTDLKQVCDVQTILFGVAHNGGALGCQQHIHSVNCMAFYV